jgi:hypothetical protein
MARKRKNPIFGEHTININDGTKAFFVEHEEYHLELLESFRSGTQTGAYWSAFFYYGGQQIASAYGQTAQGTLNKLSRDIKKLLKTLRPLASL